MQFKVMVLAKNVFNEPLRRMQKSIASQAYMPESTTYVWNCQTGPPLKMLLFYPNDFK